MVEVAARGEEHVVGGSATLTRERLACLAWLDRREPVIPVEQEGQWARDGGRERDPDEAAHPERLFRHPSPVRRVPRGLDGLSQTQEASVAWLDAPSSEEACLQRRRTK